MKFKSFIKTTLASASVAALPLLASAQGTFQSTYFTQFLDQVKTIMKAVIPLLITAAIIIFFYEIVMFIKSKDKGDAAKAEAARMGIVWSLVAIFIMLSFLGIIRILQSATGTANQGDTIDQADIPQVTF